MGYSATAPVMSHKARERMSAFLKEHYRPWHIVAHGHKYKTELLPLYDPTSMVCREGMFSYDDGKIRIGFNYSTSYEIAEFLWTFLRWVSLKVGRRRVFPYLSKVGITSAVPYTVYDGQDAVPSLLDETGALKATDQYSLACDAFGEKLYPREFHERVGFSCTDFHKLEYKRHHIAGHEMRRLDALWRELE